MLPVEIRLNILEFGGGDQLSLCLRDDDIIGRIRMHYPLFNYQKWRQAVDMKKQFIARVNGSNILPLYNYIRGNRLSIKICPPIYTGDYGRIGIISISGFKVSRRRDIQRSIHAILSKSIYRTIDGEVSISDSKEVRMAFADRDYQRIKRELIDIWLCKSRRTNTIFNKVYGLEYIPMEINILHIPTTLSSFLTYTIYRNRTFITKIQYNPLLPVYNVLSGYRWSIRNNGDNSYSMLINEIIHIPDNIKDILSSANILFQRYNETLVCKIDETISKSLTEIDQFYHPYAIHSITYFS